MIRRMQLLEVERRFSAQRAAAMSARIREGLLRDNKVVPPVLAVLAFLIFAWLAAGVLMGEPGGEEEQRASNQASVGQRSEEDLDLGAPETPAPEAENRDADSFAAFEPKDPFRELIPKAGESKAKSKAGEGKTESKASEGKAESKAGQSKNKAGESKAGESKSRTGESKSKAGGGKAGDDFIDQTFPGAPDSRGGTGGGGPGSDTNQGIDGGGSENLFNSGGDPTLLLPTP